MEDKVKCPINISHICVSKVPNKIESHSIISDVLKNSTILAQFSTVLDCDEEQVNKEVKTNLLEDILLLCIRVRTFAYVKDVKEKYKQKCESGKKKATQKELKITKDIKEPKF